MEKHDAPPSDEWQTRCTYIHRYTVKRRRDCAALYNSTRDRAGDDVDDDEKKNLNEGFLCYTDQGCVYVCVCVCTVYTVPTCSGLAIQVIRPTHFVQVRATGETLASAYLKRIIIKLMPTIFIIIYICIIVCNGESWPILRT